MLLISEAMARQAINAAILANQDTDDIHSYTIQGVVVQFVWASCGGLNVRVLSKNVCFFWDSTGAAIDALTNDKWGGDKDGQTVDDGGDGDGGFSFRAIDPSKPFNPNL
jgi:hypothetical protein